MTPQQIGRYNILRELGQGAMGVVYEAEDPNIGRHVALKVVRTDQIGANREEVLRRFKNEARAAGNLNHANIITIHDAGEHEGLFFIAMEYVQGKTLADVIASEGRMPPARVVEIMRQVCSGLDFAHARGIVHRDVKPANIMLTGSQAKITDFGIANVGDGMTITGTVVGTPNYMSPEQVLGKAVDGRSDLFSVAVILYEMVTGERPFVGQSITTVLYKIVHEDPIAPRRLDGTIHPGLSAIIEKGLAKAPEARFSSGSEFAAALENYRQLASGVVSSAEIPNVQSSATLTQANLSTARVTQPMTYPTMEQAPAVTPPPAAELPKKRGFSPFLLGCFGVVALAIVSLTVVVLVAMFHKTDKTQAPTSNSTEAATATPLEPTPPSAPPAAVVKTSPAKPTKTTATLRLSSNPPGAEILLDGKATEQETPASVAIARGEHTIAVRMPGFQDASAKFKVSGGEEFEFSPQLVPLMGGVPNITVPKVVVPNVGMPDLSKLQELQRNPALSEQQRRNLKIWEKWSALQKTGQLSIMVTSNPPGATIFIDGKDTGSKTPDVIRSEAGRHTVRVELDGYAPFERVMTVAPNRGPSTVHARLTARSE